MYSTLPFLVLRGHRPTGTPAPVVKLAPAVGTTVPPAPEDPFQQTQKQQREQSSQEQLGDEAERTESGMSAHTEGTVAIIG